MPRKNVPTRKRSAAANLKPFQPGQSGNPGGRPKGLRSLIQSTVGENAERLVEFWLLVAFESDYKVKQTLGTRSGPRWQDRITAVSELTDRGFGKPVQGLEHTGKDGGPLEVGEIVTYRLRIPENNRRDRP